MFEVLTLFYSVKHHIT